MAKIKGTNILAAVTPFTTEDKYATHCAKYGQGGWRSVETLEERNAITDDRLEEGMAVYVKSEEKFYILERLDTTIVPYGKVWKISEQGKIDDVLVNGESVVENKIANITVPTKVSDLDNDSNFQTGQEVSDSIASATAPIIQSVTDEENRAKQAEQNLDNAKVSKVSTADRVYGTDSQGNQTTYDKNSFGQVDDVKVNGTSVVSNKIASITMPTKVSDLTNDSNYQTGIEVQSAISTATAHMVETGDNVSLLTNDADYQSGTDVASSISTHNSDPEAHADIRNAIAALDEWTPTQYTATTTNFVVGNPYTVEEAFQRTASLFAGTQGEIDVINGKIPAQASSSNQLADKNFVNSTVASNAANFRGNWATWADVPTNVADYPEDYAGNKTPTNNDYMVVDDASDYNIQNDGAWRFIYIGDWTTDGKSGWNPQYRIGHAFTQEQQAAIDSGITANMVDNYVNPTSTAATAYNARITAVETDKRDIINSANKVYATDANGANKNDLVYATGATADTIAQRGTNGVLKVGTPTDNADATTKLYVDTIASAKQDTLVSGTNIKTLNNNSLLGSGNIEIPSGKTYVAGDNITITEVNIPSDVTPVEYVQSDGTGYIDTGKPYKSTSVITLKGKAVVAENAFVAGSGTSHAGTDTVGYKTVNLLSHANLGFMIGTSGYSNDTDKEYETIVIDLANGKEYFNGTEFSYAAAPNESLNTYLFAFNENGSSYQPGKVKLYGYKQVDNGVVVLDLIPAKRNGVYGLLNLVNNAFLTCSGLSGGNETSYAEISATVPTVNNATVTINQGGTQKGQFTLNQSSNANINLDAGLTATYNANTKTITFA